MGVLYKISRNGIDPYYLCDMSNKYIITRNEHSSSNHSEEILPNM